MKQLTIILIFVTQLCYGQNNNPTKLGLGIVAIEDTYNTTHVTIYTNKGLKTTMEDFKLNEQLKNIQPYYFKPDYGLCYFVCLEKTNDYYKILINDTEEGYLFLVWGCNAIS